MIRVNGRSEGKTVLVSKQGVKILFVQWGTHNFLLETMLDVNSFNFTKLEGFQRLYWG